jgi:Flp pilus assembly protein TadG
MVAIQILVLTALSAFVLDYGLLWLGRRQAQNAADAGALAGSIALAKDDKTWALMGTNALVTSSAKNTAETNNVLGVAPVALPSLQCPPWMTAPNNVNCIRVDVYRDGTNGSSALPVFFGRLLSSTPLGIKATATAQVVAANGSGCMRPWFIVDWYDDVNRNNQYDAGIDVYPPGYDAAAPPLSGRGIGSVVTFYNNGGPSSYGQLDVGNGGAAINYAIGHCYNGPPFFVGQVVATKPGATVGPEAMGMDDLLAWDPDATWNAGTQEVVGGCSSTGTCVCGSGPCPYGGTQSPRIVQAAICSPAEATCNGTVPGVGTIHITNLLTFFITGYTRMGNNLYINAVLVGSAGLFQPGPVPAGGPAAAFITVQLLVQ